MTKIINTRYKSVFLKGRPVPLLCTCGGYSRIGGNKANVASYFWDVHHSEFVCSTCGLVL